MKCRAALATVALALPVSLLAVTAVLAADLRVGATAQVKANSMWFEVAAQLAAWQQVKRRADAKVLAGYESKVTQARQAWRFLDPLSVKILAYDKARHHVKVEQLTAGRLQGSTWYVDASAF